MKHSCPFSFRWFINVSFVVHISSQFYLTENFRGNKQNSVVDDGIYRVYLLNAYAVQCATLNEPISVEKCFRSESVVRSISDKVVSLAQQWRTGRQPKISYQPPLNSSRISKQCLDNYPTNVYLFENESIRATRNKLWMIYRTGQWTRVTKRLVWILFHTLNKYKR